MRNSSSKSSERRKQYDCISSSMLLQAPSTRAYRMCTQTSKRTRAYWLEGENTGKPQTPLGGGCMYASTVARRWLHVRIDSCSEVAACTHRQLLGGGCMYASTVARRWLHVRIDSCSEVAACTHRQLLSPFKLCLSTSCLQKAKDSSRLFLPPESRHKHVSEYEPTSESFARAKCSNHLRHQISSAKVYASRKKSFKQ